jgi:predicted metalloprotease
MENAMRWGDYRQSDNVEDRRGDYGGGGGGGMMSSLGGGGRLGIGTVIILGLLGYVFGIDPRVLIGGATLVTGLGGRSAQTAPAPSTASTGAPTDQTGRFVSTVLAQTEDVWSQVLPDQANIRYVKPPIVLFSGQTRSGCGQAQSAMGPFYCPIDQKVYLDTSFFDDMKRKLGGGGDFAYAYVIAHEVGHHVENLLGILPKVQQAQERAATRQEANQYSVRVELLADCLAGVWAANGNQQFQLLEAGDIEKGMATAQAIGDDRLQRQSQGYVVPDSFTHGSAQQRQQALTLGLKTGKIDECRRAVKL